MSKTQPHTKKILLEINKIHLGDCLDLMRELPSACIQCIVTSPPYWALRDYDLLPTKWPDGWVGCLGLEPSPDLFINHIIQIFREIKRILRDDGTLWLNMGDCYTASKPRLTEALNAGGKRNSNKPSFKRDRRPREDDPAKSVPNLPPKNLVGMPWRVALALQADGWYLRRDIIWHKPNAMPESVNDRPSTAHEYIFLITKSRKYYYDAHAIKEPASKNTHSRGHGVNPKAAATTRITSRRNKRSVWTIPTASCKDAHFATFPPAIPEICIKAGTSEKGACPVCGAPWKRIVEPSENYKKHLGRDILKKNEHDKKDILGKGMSQKRTRNP